MPDKNIIDMELYASIGNQIKTARKIKGISLDTLSELIGGAKTKSTLKRYEDGTSRIEVDILKAICDQIGLNYLDVISNARESLNKSTDEIKPVNIIYNDYFPLHYCTNLSAGSPSELLEAEPDAIVYVPIKFQSRKKRLHAFLVNGTSMNNVIEDGSIVIAEEVPDTVIKEGTIVVAWFDGEATVKRIYPGDTQVTLMPDSTDKGHQPIIVNTQETQIYIFGRVIWHMNPDDIADYY
ncbi:LexA family transcriptional regulator [Faecalicoccus pleomorphus]|uniref:helix-turn-helix domain-containing protein n=1 Tax=Faecalicoccus pleomorphus TaxID=1323 RepID=UPI0014301E63|nr:XRE family transcriptional regulator [Faecalicoccus pleomorphus]NJE40587.1 LexA family transcriptional regulator [Faecalicoccus pleomorphus]